MLKSDAHPGAVPPKPADGAATNASRRPAAGHRGRALFETLRKAGLVTVIHVGDTPRIPSDDTASSKPNLAVPAPFNHGGAL
jgi:hypothetical protein